MPNLTRLKRKDSSKIGVKENSRSHRQKLADSRRIKGADSKKDGQSGSNSTNNNNNHVNNETSDSKINQIRKKKINNMDYSDESVKSHYQIRPNSGIAVAAVLTGPIKTSSNSSNNTSAIGCNENCRLTISFQNKTASFQKLVKKNSVELDESVSSRLLRGGTNAYDDVRYESSRNLSSKIWSWISSQNYLNDDDIGVDEELESLHKISSNPVLKQSKIV